jgi:hypothetical protein
MATPRAVRNLIEALHIEAAELQAAETVTLEYVRLLRRTGERHHRLAGTQEGRRARVIPGAMIPRRRYLEPAMPGGLSFCYRL